jgi:regulatory protein
VDDSPKLPAFERAAALLAARPHFAGELRRKLAARGYDREEVEEALTRLSSLGYLDDESLAAAEAERLRERKGLSRSGVAAELARKGVERGAVAAAVAGVSPGDELDTARAAAERWLAGRRGDGAALARHLARKGYAGHVIFRVLKDLKVDAPAGTDAD